MVAMVFAASPVDVRSTTNCPSTEDVVERLLPLLPAAPGPVEGQDVAEVQVDEVQANGAMELHLRLARSDGSVIGDRRLLMHGTCQDVAEVVATVIAAWKTQPLPSDAPDVAPVPAFKEGDVLSQVRASQRRSPQIRPFQIVVGAVLGAAFVGGIAATGGLDVALGRMASHWQVRLGFTGETARQLNLSPGQVDWQHTSASASVLWRVIDPFWLLSLDAGPVAGWATLAGRGFSPSRQQRSFEYGVTAGLRAGRSFGRWNVWAEWRTNLWGQGQRATLTGAAYSSSADLSQVDTAVGLGLSVMLFR
jgi:hypothetical protein